MRATYSTKNAAIAAEITPALGRWGHDFDVESIADEVLDWHNEYDDSGNLLLSQSGFRLCVNNDEFWEVVARHVIIE